MARTVRGKAKRNSRKERRLSIVMKAALRNDEVTFKHLVAEEVAQSFAAQMAQQGIFLVVN